MKYLITIVLAVLLSGCSITTYRPVSPVYTIRTVEYYNPPAYNVRVYKKASSKKYKTYRRTGRVYHVRKPTRVYFKRY